MIRFWLFSLVFLVFFNIDFKYLSYLFFFWNFLVKYKYVSPQISKLLTIYLDIRRRRKWQPTPVFWPGESYGQKSLASPSPWDCKESNMTEWLTLHHLRALVQLSHSVMSNSLRPHGQQHARLPWPSQLPELVQTHVHQVSDAIQPSHPVSSPSPAFNLSQHPGLF